VEGIGITNHPRSRVLGHGEMVRIIMQGRKKMYEKFPGGKKENATCKSINGYIMQFKKPRNE
jgi:hypothetical protein